jgi:ribose-phosphate pyrophosphokinase
MITLYADEIRIEFKQWKFPGGEVGVQLIENKQCTLDTQYRVEVKYENSDDIFILLNLCNALEVQEIPRVNITCSLPYFPYARQDRVCSVGESKALEVFVEVLSNMYCQDFLLKDVHSEVTLRLLREYGINYREYSQDMCAISLPTFDTLIAPDKGASEKAKSHYQAKLGNTEVIFMTKERKDNKVVYLDYPYNTIKGNVCVVDDICDYGGTFLALGEMLKRTQPNIASLSLYVTHGLIGKGTQELKKFYSTIYVHNLMNSSVKDEVTVI